MNTDKTILHLRPHHFLCIPNYRGHGYSSRFDEKMKAVIAQLQEGSGAEVRITQGVDDLCGACPHCTGSCCDSEMPALFDSRFLARLFYGSASFFGCRKFFGSRRLFGGGQFFEGGRLFGSGKLFRCEQFPDSRHVRGTAGGMLHRLFLEGSLHGDHC